MVRLRAQKVTQKTLTRYLQEIAKFKMWLRSQKRRWNLSKLDNLATRYITHLQETEMRECHEASYLVYGLQLLHCDGPKQFFLPNTKQALGGWKNQRPGSMRLPVPEEVVFDFVQYFVNENLLNMAMAILLQTHCYLRPSECLSLTRQHVCFPATGRYSKWGLIIAPQELGVRTKTGHFEDSVVIGDHPETGWIAGLFAIFMRHVSGDLFPGLTLHQYETKLAQAERVLLYPAKCVTPHVFRHTGPSNDFYHQRRDLNAIQKRGRWRAKASVRRYEKSSLLIKRWEVVAKSRSAIVNSASQTMPKLFKKALLRWDR